MTSATPSQAAPSSLSPSSEAKHSAPQQLRLTPHLKGPSAHAQGAEMRCSARASASIPATLELPAGNTLEIPVGNTAPAGGVHHFTGAVDETNASEDHCFVATQVGQRSKAGCFAELNIAVAVLNLHTG